MLSELEMKNKEEELNVIIEELRKSIASLQDKLVKEESEKLVSFSILWLFTMTFYIFPFLFPSCKCLWLNNQDAMDSYTREKEARAAVEKVKASLSEELAKTQQEKLNANQKVM